MLLLSQSDLVIILINIHFTQDLLIKLKIHIVFKALQFPQPQNFAFIRARFDPRPIPGILLLKVSFINFLEVKPSLINLKLRI